MTIQNLDGWANILTNSGGAGDPNSAMRIVNRGALDSGTLSALYRLDGIARRVVDVPVDDALREWIEADDALIDALEAIGAKKQIERAAKWARLFGGAGLLILADDGGDLNTPLNERRVSRVVGLRAYDRDRITWDFASIQQDPRSPRFGEPVIYRVSPIQGVPFDVHHSRLMIFDGEEVSEQDRIANNGWGDSALQAPYESIRNFATASNASTGIVRDFVQTVLSISGLSDMIRSGQDQLVRDRVTLIDLTRSVANTVFLDADGESYSKQASSVAGLSDLWDRFALHVAGTTGIPVTKLLGRSPAGLNATGEGDMRNWHDVVRAYQSDTIRPVLQRVIDLLAAQRDGRIADAAWSFPDLNVPSEKEWAEIKKINAEADAIYIDRGGADAETLFIARFGESEYKTELVDMKPMPDVEPETETPPALPSGGASGTGEEGIPDGGEDA